MELATFFVRLLSVRIGNVCLCDQHATSLFTAGTLTGFDASGHIAEETKHAK